MIRFTCPHCGQLQQIDDQFAEQVTCCIRCRGELTTPSLADAARVAAQPVPVRPQYRPPPKKPGMVLADIVGIGLVAVGGSSWIAGCMDPVNHGPAQLGGGVLLGLGMIVLVLRRIARR